MATNLGCVEYVAVSLAADASDLLVAAQGHLCRVTPRLSSQEFTDVISGLAAVRKAVHAAMTGAGLRDPNNCPTVFAAQRSQVYAVQLYEAETSMGCRCTCCRRSGRRQRQERQRQEEKII